MEEKNTNDKSISEKEYKELKAKYESFKLYNNKKTIICVGMFTTMLTMMFCLLIIFDTLMNRSFDSDKCSFWHKCDNAFSIRIGCISKQIAS